MADRWMRGPGGRYFIPDWWAFGPGFLLDEIELGTRAALWLAEADRG